MLSRVRSIVSILCTLYWTTFKKKHLQGHTYLKKKKKNPLNVSTHCRPVFFKDDLDENSKNLARTKCRPGVELPTNCNYQRRRSRAVLYHLSGQFDKHNRAKSKLQQLNKVHYTHQTHSRKRRYLFFIEILLNNLCLIFMFL